ncbi:hypothetical protein [Rubricoccus marinus]|uniref:Uncharacterized protein n=1 Tax=Rubricoccus marinus TaxID=716817 RepID=A0A259TUC1_9BACT|nr:hypothetical protein [Rubricoccus marinus]OZC01365.1 hypothetical protein BSZ36_18165 [Rubricoccus marinus]
MMKVSARAATPLHADTARPEAMEAKCGERRPVAVFVAHGMGQQLSFATLDETVGGMVQALGRRGVGEGRIDIKAAPVMQGRVRTHRVEICVDGGESVAPVHVYEGYWAPLTEGEVTLRDVLRFLIRGAWHGLRKGVGQPIERFMFERRVLHKVPGGAFGGLLATTLVLGSLVLLNAVIAGVVVDASFDVVATTAAEDSRLVEEDTTGGEERNPAPLVTRALTALVFGYLALTVGLGVLLVLTTVTARYRRGEPGLVRRLWLGVLQVGLWVWVVATIGVGVGTLAMLASAAGLPRLAPGPVAVVLAVALVSGAVAGWLSKRDGMKRYEAYRIWEEEHGDEGPSSSSDRRPLAGARLTAVTFALAGSVTVVLACLVALLSPVLPRWLDGNDPLTKVTVLRPVVWVLLFGVSAYIRNVIVQYLGDVVAYISPHTLDRFADLRRAIREASLSVLRAVYHARGKDGMPLYEGVAVVGHSLGSVVAYDALNRMLAEDAGSTGPGVLVQERTRLLLTFGSPLDKTAYIFRAQNLSLSDIREALANAAQPLILDPSVRTFPWVNVHSPRDVIGSALDLYDVPRIKGGQDIRVDRLRSRLRRGRKNSESLCDEHALAAWRAGRVASPYCVHDIEDLEARIPLVAHTEHWKTRAVFDVLVAAVFEGLSESAPRPVEETTVD